MSNPKPNHRPAEDPYTYSTADSQEFTDSPGGAPLEEALARPRRGRSGDGQQQAPLAESNASALVKKSFIAPNRSAA